MNQKILLIDSKEVFLKNCPIYLLLQIKIKRKTVTMFQEIYKKLTSYYKFFSTTPKVYNKLLR